MSKPKKTALDWDGPSDILVNIRMPKELKKDFETLCKKRNRTFAALIKRLMIEELLK